MPVGNESGMVGLYLMEHPAVHTPPASACMDAELDRYWPADNKGTGMHAIVADRHFSIEHGLYGCSLQCSRKTRRPRHGAVPRRRSPAGRTFTTTSPCDAEMLPSAKNRVVLTAERNRWGLHRPAARCVIDARDFQNVEQTLRIFGETLIRLGRGRVRVNNDRIYKDVWGQGHTLGTTRMGTSRTSQLSTASAGCTATTTSSSEDPRCFRAAAMPTRR